MAFVGEVALFALFAVSYFKADDYPTDITAVLVLVFMPLIFIVAILAIVVTIISFRRARNMYQKDDDGHSCELTTATRV